ncbi:MAG TPA: hypothetical protein VLA34_11770, partial [Candidatus Krumholzibacterium sp.]|nr:hypothetical protein [Candidatus Krumholzibacterium sp.]
TKGKLTIRNESDQGVMEGKIEIEGKYKIAIDGGYIVKGENSSEMTGEMITTDLAGKESSSDVSSVTYEEIVLEK